MKANKILISCILFLVFSSGISAQISPPGLGKANTAEWTAIGLKEDIDTDKKVSSLTYLGIGNSSNPSNNNPLDRTAIYILNQEFFKQINHQSQYSIAASYRWQNRYKKSFPFERDEPEAKQEIRFYGRYTYSIPKNRFVFSGTLRPELRTFYTPGFSPYSEKFQLRARFKGKISFDINKLKTQKLIASLEILLSKSKSLFWNKFDYRESRICLYYSLSPNKINMTFNIGYMNNIIGKAFRDNVHYLALDIVFKNVFGRNKKGN